jgi:hypothetical protein
MTTKKKQKITTMTLAEVRKNGPAKEGVTHVNTYTFEDMSFDGQTSMDEINIHIIQKYQIALSDIENHPAVQLFKIIGPGARDSDIEEIEEPLEETMLLQVVNYDYDPLSVEDQISILIRISFAGSTPPTRESVMEEIELEDNETLLGAPWYITKPTVKVIRLMIRKHPAFVKDIPKYKPSVRNAYLKLYNSDEIVKGEWLQAAMST